ncbi:UNUSUAL FLORAL ORGANS [Hibiscus trionum]|uniref:UNUSUAL FLORAL ORGANS n=1 Tax=Hibiscus trionum TaxID=183268 RepID=A0A9W7IAK7_HIBTR|nr:UNUSUAL FLORAL ORGANS [Hibiscus trionum]
MWSNLPFDVLAKIFSFLSPDSLARARSACRNWHMCSETYPMTTSSTVLPQHHQAWFLALPTRNRGQHCYVHNPVTDNWHMLSFDFLPDPVRPVASIGSLILVRPTNCTALQLALCNPFTRQFRYLPMLNITRTNPAVGVVTLDSGQLGPNPRFRVYVAGGMSKAPHGGATYESKLEMYDSVNNKWHIMGPVPMEFAVRLTVWTPNESVYSKGILYWITSARAYSVMGFEIGANTWRGFSVPMADKLEFATLLCRNSGLMLAGGTSEGEACIWELKEGDRWGLIQKVPMEMGRKLLGGKSSWGNTKCVGSEGGICLYRELGSGMVVWREMKEKATWAWFWIQGCHSIGGKHVQNLPIKGVFLHPNLSPFPF